MSWFGKCWVKLLSMKYENNLKKLWQQMKLWFNKRWLKWLLTIQKAPLKSESVIRTGLIYMILWFAPRSVGCLVVAKKVWVIPIPLSHILPSLLLAGTRVIHLVSDNNTKGFSLHVLHGLFYLFVEKKPYAKAKKAKAPRHKLTHRSLTAFQTYSAQLSCWCVGLELPETWEEFSES